MKCFAALLLPLCSFSIACTSRYQAYEVHSSEGTEVWRLDTKTGQTCWMHMPPGSSRIEILNKEVANEKPLTNRCAFLCRAYAVLRCRRQYLCDERLPQRTVLGTARTHRSRRQV